ncbi:UDP-glucose 4-epimerase [Trichodelitschia bisporula]|uniref:UDP-glucose 4-epimerase n=1 Tax=Trichodelitschia bisporula TaxID=703511 RepID=A0A6G1HZH1_9PEZI|nr:UDP-glucose 4-epimerase [Trichodelitschia bisporula]
MALTRPSSPDSQGWQSGTSTPRTENSVLFGDLFGDDDFILVVGGLGYIGSHTTWELLKAGRSVVIVDNLSNAFRTVLERLQTMLQAHYPDISQAPLIRFHNIDYRNVAAMRIVLEMYARTPSPERPRPSSIAGVIHFAAYKAVAESVEQPLRYYANNVAGMIDFCGLLDEFGVKTFVLSSSATVYGELANKGGRLPEEYCTHATTNWQDAEGRHQTTFGGSSGLTNPYGRTKWMCEAILHDLAASDPEWTVVALRYFNPIGCDASGHLGEDPRATPNNLMPVVVRVLTGELEVLDIFGTDWDTRDGTAIRDFIHVTDLARGHLAALSATSDKLATGFHSFNLGTGTGHTVKEVVAAMEGASGKSIAVRHSERREGDVAMCIADPKKAATLLGWKTEKTLDDCCRDICRFLRLLRL